MRVKSEKNHSRTEYITHIKRALKTQVVAKDENGSNFFLHRARPPLS